MGFGVRNGSSRRAATPAQWIVPELLWPTTGHAEGETPLNAFDNALVAAGVGHWNLVRVTSIAPATALVVEGPLEIEAGCLVPAVMASATSSKPGQRITACIGIGLSENGHGMIMEHSGPGAPAEMEAIVRRMVHAALDERGFTPTQTIVRSVSHVVERVGSCAAAVVLWWR